jgi:hypothetical protein
LEALIPVWFPYALHALVLIAALAAFFLLKAENQQLRRELATRLDEIERTKPDLTSLEKRLDQLASAPAKSPPLNFQCRTQVLRLAKRGERPEQISATLNLPRNEVDLILKIQNYLLAN